MQYLKDRTAESKVISMKTLEDNEKSCLCEAIVKTGTKENGVYVGDKIRFRVIKNKNKSSATFDVESIEYIDLK